MFFSRNLFVSLFASAALSAPTAGDGLLSIPLNVKAASSSPSPIALPDSSSLESSLSSDEDWLESDEFEFGAPSSTTSFDVFMVFDLDPTTMTVLVNGAPADLGAQKLQVPVATSVHTHELLVDVMVTVTDLGDGAFLVQEQVVGMTEIDMTVTQSYPISQTIALDGDGVVRGSPCHHTEPHVDGDAVDDYHDEESDASAVEIQGKNKALAESRVHFVDNDGNYVDDEEDDEENKALFGGGSCSHRFYYYLARILDFGIFVCLIMLFFNLISYLFSLFFSEYTAAPTQDDGGSSKEAGKKDGYTAVDALDAVEKSGSNEKSLLMQEFPPRTSDDLPAYSG